jgi:hypothetical protein
MAGVITRRHFVGATGAGALGLSADWFGRPRYAFDSTPVSTSAAPAAGWADEVEDRVREVLRSYDAQGIHRTGTDVDRASGEWLREQARSAGAAVSLQSFPLERLEISQAFVEVGGRRIDGLPFFDAGLTSASGISAPIGPGGVHVATADAAAISTEGEFLASLRRDRTARAIIVLTAGGTPGLVPSNARRFAEPYGCPVLQVPAAPGQELLATAASSGSPVRVVCEAARIPATAVNVVAEVPGRDRDLAPVVVITPRSGWWHCASERGGGIACWIETVHAAASASLPRRVLCLASSGHELGHLGLDRFLHAEAPLVKGAHAWVHLGANIGAGPSGSPVAGVRLQASDDELDAAMSLALAAAAAPIADRLPRGRVPAGEARNLHLGGARYVSLIGQGNRWFHHRGDRFPEAVIPVSVARYARAVADCVTRLART